MQGLIKNIILSFIILSSCFVFSQPSNGKTTRILFVLDASFSMKNVWKTADRWSIAKNTLIEVLDSLKDRNDLEFALRVYGHQADQKERNCKDSRLEVSFSRNSEERIKKKLQDLKPIGTTPIAYSIEQAARDFTIHPNSRNIVILITDGLESCDGDPCAISREMQKKQVFLKPFVVAMGVMPNFFKELECIGTAKNAKSEENFNEVFWDIINKTISGCSAEVDLLDIQGKPIETDLNMSFYDSLTGNLLHNFYHTMNARGKPDTMYLEALNTYNLVVHTIPPVSLEGIKLKPNQHNVISLSCPQGELEVKLQALSIKNTYRNKIRYILRKAGDKKIVNIEHLDVTTKYLVGDYDLEILTLPRTIIKGINISQDKKTSLQIPNPGMASITSIYPGVGGIFEIKNGRMIKVYSLGGKEVLREVLAMQPGSYKVIFRPYKATQSESTIEKTFTIESDKSIIVKLN